MRLAPCKRGYAVAHIHGSDTRHGGGADEIIEAGRDSARLVIPPENAAALTAIEQKIIAIQEQALALHKAKQTHSITESEYAERIRECSSRMTELEAQQAEM